MKNKRITASVVLMSLLVSGCNSSKVVEPIKDITICKPCPKPIPKKIQKPLPIQKIEVVAPICTFSLETTSAKVVKQLQNKYLNVKVYKADKKVRRKVKTRNNSKASYTYNFKIFSNMLWFNYENGFDALSEGSSISCKPEDKITSNAYVVCRIKAPTKNVIFSHEGENRIQSFRGTLNGKNINIDSKHYYIKDVKMKRKDMSSVKYKNVTKNVPNYIVVGKCLDDVCPKKAYVMCSTKNGGM